MDTLSVSVLRFRKHK
nr:unnamed protein product [Callosobruchus analis]CAI5866794.1 unnamed protein product [Callosobruchus analis]CAI5867930.1 unnamed protein product [Callosobruchus analis]